MDTVRSLVALFNLRDPDHTQRICTYDGMVPVRNIEIFKFHFIWHFRLGITVDGKEKIQQGNGLGIICKNLKGLGVILGKQDGICAGHQLLKDG